MDQHAQPLAADDPRWSPYRAIAPLKRGAYWLMGADGRAFAARVHEDGGLEPEEGYEWPDGGVKFWMPR